MFNEAHWHIAINHLPVVGYLVALVIALCGLFIKDRMLNLIAWMISIFSSVFTVLAQRSGEPAHEQIVEAAGVSQAYLSAHERWGDWMFYAAIGVGILSIGGWFMNRTKTGGCRKCMVMLIILMLGMNGLGTITAALGGGVRHPEAHGDRFGEIIKQVGLIEAEQEMLQEEPQFESGLEAEDESSDEGEAGSD